ncbi:MAG: tRNA (adenosine(37)-N6)-threonylcarbamoyltransferase complex dimerization subunit type 1 TsaB [Bacilli bacterium]|nr:tRNA (adenosine(37)-N6)-threonylcarbamoyltransferase complex dimerization subunit type 1 TsaB [Bacilli bacterium]
MICLFIDTSSIDVSIAIIKANKIISSITKSIPNEHSIYTTQFIDDVLKESNLEPNDIDKIMVVNGPGSFTGVRIGVTIAKTMAYLLNKEVIPISSLKMLSLSINHDYCLSILNANHNNYYFGLYDKDNNEIIKEQFNTKEKVLEIIKKYKPIIVSNNNITIDNIEISKQELDYINIVNYYLNKESVNSHLLVPNYLKLPEALEKKSD